MKIDYEVADRSEEIEGYKKIYRCLIFLEARLKELYSIERSITESKHSRKLDKG
jgi:hypothetical protein